MLFVCVCVHVFSWSPLWLPGSARQVLLECRGESACIVSAYKPSTEMNCCVSVCIAVERSSQAWSHSACWTECSEAEVEWLAGPPSQRDVPGGSPYSIMTGQLNHTQTLSFVSLIPLQELFLWRICRSCYVFLVLCTFTIHTTLYSKLNNRGCGEMVFSVLR